MRGKVFYSVVLLLNAALAPLAATPPGPPAVYLSYQQAQPILDSLAQILPDALKNPGPAGASSIWQKWVQDSDKNIRSRLVRGDEESLVNFMLFGTSFTRRPRVTLQVLARYNPDSAGEGSDGAGPPEMIRGRADDLIEGMRSPGNNERLWFGRRLVDSGKFTLGSPDGRARVKEYLLANLNRIISERQSYARTLERARQQGNPAEEFIERSHLFSGRGLASDTSLMPDFAIEKSLEELRGRGFIRAGSVRRVGIIGPGLDFADKQDGYDFYPEQTIQPFAVIDSLLRLGLADAGNLRVTTLDISSRINDHLDRARASARRGIGYVVQLPLDAEKPWASGAVDYWGKFGGAIGVEVRAAPVPAGLGPLKLRAIKIRPNVVTLVQPADVNVVVQHLDLAESERFDLVIATNILVYYDVFEQSLALANVRSMLKPGGILLSNDVLLELPSSGMRSVGYKAVEYSSRSGDGDNIVWYQRSVGD
jgi:SAM-dependent methyltransferase